MTYERVLLIFRGTLSTSCLAALLLTAAAPVTQVHADQGDCAQPATTGAEPKTTDCLFILKAAVGPGCRAPPQQVRPVFGQADRYRPGSW